MVLLSVVWLRVQVWAIFVLRFGLLCLGLIFQGYCVFGVFSSVSRFMISIFGFYCQGIGLRFTVLGHLVFRADILGLLCFRIFYFDFKVQGFCFKVLLSMVWFMVQVWAVFVCWFCLQGLGSFGVQDLSFRIIVFLD